jgi:hypothetical protein
MAVPQNEKTTSAFYPADNPAIIAHLNSLQAIITRLAGNSVQCKTWCLAIVSTLFALAGATKNDKIVATAIIPIVIFGLVDAAYLEREKAYRELYNSVAAAVRNGTYALSDCFNLTPSGNGNFGSALRSWSVWPVYLGLIVAYALVRTSGLLK